MIHYFCKDISKYGNWGDTVSKYIYEKITGKDGVFCYNIYKYPHFFITGSILKVATNKTTVLGAGFSAKGQMLKSKPKIKIVRGLISKGMLEKQGFRGKIVCGDPVSILPKLYNPKIKKKYKLGIIPHYVDKKLASVHRFIKQTGAFFIDIEGNTENVINQVLSCEKIISSSLHGIILPHAYGIPARWIKLSNKLAGDGTKFHDYFSSIGIQQVFLDCRKQIPTNVIRHIPLDTGILKDDIFSVLKKELK